MSATDASSGIDNVFGQKLTDPKESLEKAHAPNSENSEYSNGH